MEETSSVICLECKKTFRHQGFLQVHMKAYHVSVINIMWIFSLVVKSYQYWQRLQLFASQNLLGCFIFLWILSLVPKENHLVSLDNEFTDVTLALEDGQLV